MIYLDSLFVTLMLADRIPLPPPPAKGSQDMPKF